MSGSPKKKKLFKPLLVAGTGVAMMTMGGSGCFVTGNLVAPNCDEEPEYCCSYDSSYCEDAGVEDAGTDDGGTDAGP